MLAIDVNNIDNQLLDLKKKYGNIVTLWLPQPIIIFGGNDELKTAFIKNGEKTAGRPDFKIMELLLEGNYGVVFSSDIFWRNQRRFALHVLRDFGVGRPILENAIISQASDVCDYFKSLNGDPVDPSKTIITCVGNIIHQLAFGITTDIRDDTIYNFRNKMLEASKLFNHPITLLMDLWEPLKYLKFLGGKSYQKLIDYNNEMIDYCRAHIEEHRKTISYENEPRDYIDAFLIEQQKQNPLLKRHGEWSDWQLIGTLYDLFAAGMETTSTTTQMFIFYILHYPDVQKKIHVEIDAVIGRDKIITMSDQAKLPYFNACLQEAQRVTTVLPMNLFHRTIEDLEIDGYDIPKGTTVIPQFESVHKDEKEFRDPQKFDPSRFLDSENNYKKDERITPFSLGKRACLGESLARMELFLFAATFFQHFEFQPENPDNLPLFEYDYSFVKTIKPFKVRILERKQ
uniref:Cytochrome P450 n=2 Tax=Panagrolaimus sp. PS1159 TaxID=55785 RepID=A0AC35GNT7_9BILA